MDKFIILTTKSDVIALGIENIKTSLFSTGRGGAGIFGFTTVPGALSSKTVYNRSQIDAMMRDTTSVFYSEGY